MTHDDASLLHRAADLLYTPDDQRATPWPNPQELGRIRHDLRSLADTLDLSKEQTS